MMKRSNTFVHVRFARVACILALLIFAAGEQRAAILPSGFSAVQIATGISGPTAMAEAPDGRIFVCEQSGALRIIRNDTLLAAPFLTVAVDAAGERGLLGVAFHPAFPDSPYVYIYYTTTTPTTHNRISRFTANGNVAVPGSEVVLLDLDALSSASNHNGGALHFGPDGMLYCGVGENATPSNSQTLTNLLGKMLRIAPNGSIPTDNPFYSTATGNNRAIWALGLRNPFTFSFQRGTGRLFINDVGQATWEEINEGIAGSNYGWPTTEGYTTDTNFRSPLYEYGHGTGTFLGCAIAGGTFYNPTSVQFPSSYVGMYLFSDYCGGWINQYNPTNGTVTNFATGFLSPVDLLTSADGSLVLLAQGSATVFRIRYTASQGPVITQQPSDVTVPVGGSATLIVSATGAPTLTYQWQRNQTDISGATSPSYTLTNVQLTDNAARFRCVVTNGSGTARSNEAILTVTINQPPTAAIAQPLAGTMYKGGDTIYYAGTGIDPEQGSLSAPAFTWWVDFHHNMHIHPFLQPTSGATNGSFVIPTMGETSDTVWYRINLIVSDSGGLRDTTFLDLFPRKVTVILQTSPTGLQLTLDGQPVATPYTFTGVVGIVRTLGVPTPQTFSGTSYTFASWSDAGSVTHPIGTPATPTTYTASFSPIVTLSDLWIYQEGLVSPWISNSWSGTFTFNSTEQNYSPPNAIKAVLSPWGALRFRNGAWGSALYITPSSYTALEFLVYSPVAGQRLNILLSSEAGGSFGGGAFVTIPTANQWTVISVPISQIDPNNLPFNNVTLFNNTSTGTTVFVDNVRLVGAAGANGETAAIRENVPDQFSLGMNFPNPFNPTTVIGFGLPADAVVTLHVYNILGQIVATVADHEPYTRGFQQVTFDASGLSSGVYYYRIVVNEGEFTQFRRMVLVK